MTSRKLEIGNLVVGFNHPDWDVGDRIEISGLSETPKKWAKWKWVRSICNRLGIKFTVENELNGIYTINSIGNGEFKSTEPI